MKKHMGWFLPDHEKHLPEWMAHPKNRGTVLHGRVAYQGRKQMAALKHCRNRRVAVDVGGHCALWSFNLAHEFGQVIAFEPVAEHRECFHANTEGLTNITLRAMALGHEAGQVRIATEKGSSGNSTVAGWGDIQMATMDSLDLREVDLLKIDVEGYEENVLRGGIETVKRCRPVIVVEQKRDMAKRFGLPTLGAVHLLLELGYRQAEELSGDHVMVPA